MSNMDPFAPTAGSYSQPPTRTYPPGYSQPISSIDIGRLITSPFKSANWLMNMVWMFVCGILSLVAIGSIVANGYAAEVAVARSGGRSENWPDFDINKAADYLLRGLWPFLWNLIFAIPLGLMVGVPAALTAITSNALAQNEQQALAISIGIAGGLITVLFSILCAIVMAAVMLHSVLGNDFLKGADIAWTIDFVKKMAFTTILMGIIYWLAAVAFTILGFMVFCVGIFAVYPILALMLGDVMAQLHDIFISRGGRPAVDFHDPYDGAVHADVV